MSSLINRLFLAVMRRLLRWRWGAEEAAPRIAALEDLFRALAALDRPLTEAEDREALRVLHGGEGGS